MIRLNQRGFTIVELLVSIAILAVIAPMMATGMFQILTYTERGRAGFEAQADTRNAAAWMSQDIVMAQAAYLDYDASLSPAECDNQTFLGTFTWQDWFGDPDQPPEHTVSYCLDQLPNQSGIQLLRFYDCGPPMVIGRQMDPDPANFTITIDPPLNEEPDALTGREVTIDIISDPVRNRFQITDSKTVHVKMRPVAAALGEEPKPCYQ